MVHSASISMPESKIFPAVSSRALSYRLFLSVLFCLVVCCSLVCGHSVLSIFILALADICFCGDILFRLSYHSLMRGRVSYSLVIVVCITSGFIYSAVNTFASALWQGPCAELYFYLMLLLSSALWLERRGALERERVRLVAKKVDEFMPKSARVRKGNSYKKIFVEELNRGDEILVNAGERIAADGVLLQGEGAIDEQLITGNILPAVKRKGANVYAGTLCKTGPLHIRVTETLQFSALMEIMKALKKGEYRKLNFRTGADEGFLLLLLLFLVVSIGLFLGVSYWVVKGPLAWGIFLFLMGVVCPLVLPFAHLVPAYLGAQAAKKNRIYIQNFDVLRAIKKADVFFFDKTGTLTYGELSVSQVFPAKHSSESALLQALAAAEQSVSGPFAKAVLAYASQKGITPPKADCFEIFAGQGVLAFCARDRIFAGSLSWLAEQGFKNLPKQPQVAQTVIGVVKNKRFLGYITLADKLRPFAGKTLSFLEKNRKEVLLVSGDNECSVAAVAQEANIQKYNFDVLPKTKAEIITNLRALGKTVVMVGDGFNDILALLNADGGLVFASGQNVYNHWVDVVIKRKDLYPLVYLFKVQKKFSHILWQNRICVLVVNALWAGSFFLFPPLSVKWYTLLGANIAMLGLILLNSIRMLYIK